MRLIDTHTGGFAEFNDSETAPVYAILSHTWARPEDPFREQTYQDMVKIQEKFGLTSLLKFLEGEVLPNTHTISYYFQLFIASITLVLPFSLRAPEGSHFSSWTLMLVVFWLISILVVAACVFFRRQSIWDPDSGLSEKVRKACEIARRDGYRYIWVDSSCIDKTSSSELSEAINSMFNWYRDAQICYAFLADVPSGGDMRAEDSKFQQSRWFTRVWTLQELIAPRVVLFLSGDWKPLGIKDGLADLIQKITHIDPAILTHERKLAEESVAERMLWASRREATRVEDEAYSLLGIFGITMTTLYGEGRRAFQRLQEEILQRIPDRGLFAWGRCLATPPGSHLNQVECSSLVTPFASSPWSFRNTTGNIRRLSQEDLKSLGLQPEEYTLTPHGIRAKLSFIPIKGSCIASDSLCVKSHRDRFQNIDVNSLYLIILGSQEDHDCHGRNLLCKLCFITGAGSDIETLHVPDQGRVEWNSMDFPSNGEDFFCSVVSIIPLAYFLEAPSQNAESKAVYLPYPELSTGDRHPLYKYPPRDSLDTALTTISLSPWAKDILPPGYTISDLCPAAAENSPENSSFLTLYIPDKPFSIHIEYRHMRQHDRDKELVIFIEARIWILPRRPDLVGHADSIDIPLQGSPPYTSTIWSVKCNELQSPSRDVHVISQSEDEVALRLCLGFIAPSRDCHTHLEVVKTSSLSLDLSMGRQNFARSWKMKMRHPIMDLKFTLLGSVTRALQRRGYSVHVDQPHRNSSNSHSLSLVLSNPDSGITISIDYFHHCHVEKCDGSELHDLLTGVRVILESSSVLSDGSTMYKDGPHVARWWESMIPTEIGWDWTPDPKEIALTAPTGNPFTLHLGLALAWKSEYYLLVDIEGDGGAGSQAQINDYHPSDDQYIRKLVTPHDCIRLTLPGHIERALQMHGYEVHFERACEDDSSPYHLQLSNADFRIIIEYSYHLSTGSNGEQELTFRASIRSLSLERSQNDPAEPIGQIVEWPEMCDWQGWDWTLQKEDVTLTLPTGTELTLHLGFYLVWLSEYCITVEIVPLTLPPQLVLLESAGPSPTGAHSGNDEEGAGGDKDISSNGEEDASGTRQEDAGNDVDTQKKVASQAGDQVAVHADAVSSVAFALPFPSVGDAEVEGGNPNE